LPGGEPVDIVPMYLADTAFTHELSRRTIEHWSRTRGKGRRAPVRVLPPMDEEVLAELGARHVLRQLAALGVRTGTDRALVLAAHGTLLEPPRPIETGRVPTERIAAGIARRLRSDFGMIQIGWLNHVYGGRWTEPAADVALRMAAEAGYRSVVYYPFGFLADNAESELEGRIALRTQPGLHATHLACMNAAPEFMAALARQVAGEAGGTPRQAADAGVPAEARETRQACAGGGSG
jgi:protoheme ferro-lyase